MANQSDDRGVLGYPYVNYLTGHILGRTIYVMSYHEYLEHSSIKKSPTNDEKGELELYSKLFTDYILEEKDNIRNS